MHDKNRTTLDTAVATKFEIMVKLVIKDLQIQWHDACTWVQEAITNAWAMIARGSRPKSVRNWCTYLVSAAKRMARRDLNRNEKKPPHFSIEGLMETQGFDIEAPPPVDHEERERIIVGVRRAVASLPPRARLVVEYFCFWKHSHAEIAARLGIAPESSKAILARAKARLRSALRDLREAA